MNTGDVAALGLMSLLATVLSLAVYVWLALALGAVFRKLGDEAWKGWVPVYNVATLLRHGGLSPWLALLMFVPAGAIVVFALAAHRVGRGFGYGAGMTVVAALVPPVWASIVGFGPARWLGGAGHRWGADAGVAARPAAAPAGHAAPGPFVPPAAFTPGTPVLPGAAAPAPAAPPSAFPPPPASAFPPAAAAPAAAAPAPAAGWAPPAAATPAPAAAIPAPATPAPVAPAVSAVPGVLPDQSRAFEDTVVDTGSDVDEVSAIAPSPFAPSPAAGSVGRYAAPPVSEGLAPVPFTPQRRSAVPAAEPAAAEPDLWAPRRAGSDPLGPAELSGEVSAVAGAPVAGAPVSASGAVPLRATGDEADDEIDDRTVLARRKRVEWRLVPEAGDAIAITAEVLVLGRRPAADPAFPDAQLVDLPGGRTVSKTHARLELRGDAWLLTDLASTNGVLVRDASGAEVEVTAPVTVSADAEFLLGDERFRLARA